MSTPSQTPVPAAPHVLASRPALVALLQRLHAQSLAQEEAVTRRGKHFPGGTATTVDFEGQLVALDEDKARDMYLILRAMGARRVLEAGTSYGVSLLWLLAAVLDNTSSSTPSASSTSHPPLVIGTELETSKATIALTHVAEAFGTQPRELNLLQGDLLKTIPALKIPDNSLDAVLLDIWAPLALPTLQLVAPAKLRKGAVVLIDNSKASEERYRDLLTWIRAPDNGFIGSTLPHSGGFDLAVFVGLA